MSNGQANALKRAYVVVKENLLKYDKHVRRKPMVPIHSFYFSIFVVLIETIEFEILP